MNTTQTFTTRRQQATSAALALSITLGMLLSINLLATQPVAESHLAANAATNAQTVSRTVHSPQG
jgi:hypothetical protein